MDNMYQEANIVFAYVFAGLGAGFILCAARETNILAHLFRWVFFWRRDLEIETRDDFMGYILARNPLLHELLACKICLGTWFSLLFTGVVTCAFSIPIVIALAMWMPIAWLCVVSCSFIEPLIWFTEEEDHVG